MTSIQYLLTLLLLASCFTLPPQRDDTKTQCVMITKARIEETLGQPFKCVNETGNVWCFGHKQQPVRVLFNESDVAKRIQISTGCSGIRGLKEKLNQVVPEKARGKYRQRTDRSTQGSCKSVYEEDYECLKIKYVQENCMGCVPASITVEWK